MITLGSPCASTLDRIVQRGAGFLWWYLDLTNPSGDGLVLIWSLGLPFLPNAGPSGPAGERPALSLAVYRGGRPEFFLLQDYRRSGAPMTVGTDVLGSGQLGGSRFRVTTQTGSLELLAELDLTVPGSRIPLVGSVHLSGPIWGAPSPPADAPHLWAPLVVHGSARASLSWGSERIELAGAGYFDSNFSDQPLEQQGISRWLWGRVAFPDRTFVYYRTESEAGTMATQVLSQGPRDVGASVPGVLTTDLPARGAFGARAPRRLELTALERRLSLTLGRPVDDGPFYQRFLVRAEDEAGRLGHGVAEAVLPPLLGIAWQRPLVRMRTHVPGGSNSVWLPLFSGFRRGRVRRLLGVEAA